MTAFARATAFVRPAFKRAACGLLPLLMVAVLAPDASPASAVTHAEHAAVAAPDAVPAPPDAVPAVAETSPAVAPALAPVTAATPPAATATTPRAAPAAAAVPRYGPAPRNAQSALVQRYVDAQRAGRYADAYALLTDGERAYFGDADAYRSVFAADGIVLREARILGARGDERGRVFFVRERIAFVDHAHDAQREIEAVVPIGVLGERGALRIKDPGKPYRAFAASATSSAGGLRATVKKVDFYPDRIDVVITFVNLGANFVTLLPYGKSVLRDDKGGIYRIAASKDWAITDKPLFEGVPLAPNAQYTGSLAFAAPRIGPGKRAWSLTIAPALREGGDTPFDLTVAIVPKG